MSYADGPLVLYADQYHRPAAGFLRLGFRIFAPVPTAPMLLGDIID
jgi:hypothetical protein